MSGILLDTSAYSAFKRGHPEVQEEVRRADQIVLNPVIVGELLSGFRLGSKERKNRKEFEEFVRSPRVRLVEIGPETSERYAEILCWLRKQGTPIPTNDIWIAASAMEYGLTVIATDGHYKHTPHVICRIYEP